MNNTQIINEIAKLPLIDQEILLENLTIQLKNRKPGSVKKFGNAFENLLEQKNGKMFIKGTRISLIFIARLWRAGNGTEEIIEEYTHLSPAGIHAALAFYFANRDEIDKEIDQEIEAEKRLKFEYMQSKSKA